MQEDGNGCDLGYGGFNGFREKVAELHGKEFGEHYKILSSSAAMFLMGDERKAYYEAYDSITEQMIEDKKLNVKVADFCYQCDCDGKIRYGACKVIYDIIKDYDDNIVYGYAGRKDRALFKDLRTRITITCEFYRCKHPNYAEF